MKNKKNNKQPDYCKCIHWKACYRILGEPINEMDLIAHYCEDDCSYFETPLIPAGSKSCEFCPLTYWDETEKASKCVFGYPKLPLSDVRPVQCISING